MTPPATHSTVDRHSLATLVARIRLRVAGHSTLGAAVLTAVAVAMLAGHELAYAGTTVGDWDLLFFTGCLTVIGGLWLARGQPERFAAMLERLANRGALEGARVAVSHR